MNPATIIQELQVDGVSLTLSPSGTIKATGDGAAVNRWLTVIREHKAEIIDVLKVGAGDTAAEPFDREAWEERAAIAEFDGGLSREDAEWLAWQEDDRRRCGECGNLTHAGVCRVAAPGAAVSENRGYRPDQSRLVRCAGFVGRRA